MANKNKKPDEVRHIIVYCNKCEQKRWIKPKEWYFTASDTECETCGSHGDVTFEAKCPGCNKNLKIELKSW